MIRNDEPDISMIEKKKNIRNIALWFTQLIY